MRRIFVVIVALLAALICGCSSHKSLVLTADGLAELSGGESLSIGDTIILTGEVSEISLSKAFLTAVSDGESFTISCEFLDPSELLKIPDSAKIALSGTLCKIVSPTIYICDAKMIGIIAEEETAAPETTAETAPETTIATEETTTTAETTTEITTTTELTTAETTTEVTTTAETTTTPTPAETPRTITYILNTSSKKFHLEGCSYVKSIKNSNKAEFTGTRDELIEQGYSACKKCNP